MPRHGRFAWIALALCTNLLAPASAWAASPFPEFVDPDPATGNQFGALVVPLASGNVVVTSPGDDFQATNAGAIYLFNGANGVLISTLRASAADDLLDVSVIALANGDFVVCCPNWDNGVNANVGAVTWGNGTTGVSGVISSANSLVGSAASDRVGSGGVTALSSGNYVVASPLWKNGATASAGAVTWCNGATGRTGALSAANSLVGSATADEVGSGGVTALTNGNYVVCSPLWNNVSLADAGAATWCNGGTGRVGGLSVANSLVGSTASNEVGVGGAKALTNGNYVVVSYLWDNGSANFGAVTWGEGTAGTVGTVSSANSLVGAATGDQVGSGDVTVLTNGNYVIASPHARRISSLDVGAVTWGDGTTGVSGVVGVANSLLGTSAGDQVGSGGVTALANGNFVVASPFWNNGVPLDAGAVTWGNGATGSTGSVAVANSLVGSTAGDQVGSGGVTALPNGNYVVASASWDNGGIADAGAVTWRAGTTAGAGTISAANSLVGSTAEDVLGTSGDVTALANGNYVVASGNWHNGAAAAAGAVTWGSGTTGVSGTISAVNSLVGTNPSDRVGFAGVTALANGNYVVRSRTWNSPTVVDAGAVTWGNGATGVSGVITGANSLVGSALDDELGTDAVIALPDGNYVVTSSTWDNGPIADAGAVTWADGTIGVTGEISPNNSIVSWAAHTGLEVAVPDPVNGTFISRFLAEGGGRIRVGPVTPFVIASAADIPGDQGGWLRLTFGRSYLDHVNGSPPVSSYGVWRHIPGTLASRVTRPNLYGPADAAAIERVLRMLPASLEPRVESGSLLVTGAGETNTFPPGTWELVQSVPAIQHDQYAVAVPTISNLAANDYLVTAHTTTPSIWFISTPASGQSQDNLPPAQPANFTAAYSGGQTNLHWATNVEADLNSYALYRGASADFVPAIGNRIASLSATSFADVGPAGGYYKLSALDVNGNESSFALVTPQNTTDVGGGDPRVPFALEGVRPNPASRRALHVAFALPRAQPARLELLDMGGRRLVARDVGALGAGRHTVNLAEGQTLPAGIYWVRLTQGSNRKTVRAAVIE